MSKSRPVVLALLAVVALTAFAPAPFPKRESRVKEGLSVQALLGTWKAIRLARTGQSDQLDVRSNGVQTVTITPTQWIFDKAGQSPSEYDLRIDPAKLPAEIDFYRPGQQTPYGRGVIRREGDKLRIIYNWGEPRPAGFENQQTGYWDLTLQRE